MFHSKSLIVIAALWLCCARAINAAEIAGPRDIPYPGTLALSVDLTDLERRLFLVRESIPARPGQLTLLYPQWLPGTYQSMGRTPVSIAENVVVRAANLCC